MVSGAFYFYDISPQWVDLLLTPQNERLNFYEEQIEDLNKTEAQLLGTIQEIKETAIKRFNYTQCIIIARTKKTMSKAENNV